MKQRLISTMLALCLALTLLPASALAEEGDAPQEPAAQSSLEGENATAPEPRDAAAEAEVDGTGYETLADALNAADGATVTLLQNVDSSGADLVIRDKAVTLDLNGYELKLSNAPDRGRICLYGAAELTLQDSGDGGRLYTETPYGSGNGATLIRVNGHSSFTMDSGRIDAVVGTPAGDGQFAIGVFEWGSVTINGGTIEAGWYAISGNGSSEIYTEGQDTTITVNGGTLISAADYAIYHPQNGTLIINDGATVYGAAGGISMNAGTLEVKGGLITSKGVGSTGDWGQGTGGQSNAAINLNGEYGDVTANISGGTITAEGDAVTIAEGTKHTVNCSVSGGTFSSDPTPLLSEDYKADHEGSGYEVHSSEVAQAGNDTYHSVQAAVDAASGRTVTLLQNAEEDVTIPAGATVTLDLAGKTLCNAAGHTITNNGNLTITGSGTVDNLTHQKAALYNAAGAKAVIENGTFARSREAGATGSGNGNSYYVILNQGTLTIEDCELHMKGQYSSAIENGWYNPGQNKGAADARLTINGGSFSGGKYTIKNDDYGVLEINGGTFNNVHQDYGVLLNWNQTTIKGGTFSGTSVLLSNGAVKQPGGDTPPAYEAGTLTILDGRFTGAFGISDGTDFVKTVIRGGHFTADPSGLQDEGYYVDASTEPGYFFTVKAGTPAEPPVVVTETVEAEVSKDVPAADQSAITQVIGGASVSNVGAALSGSAMDELIQGALSDADLADADLVKIEVGVSVTAASSNLSGGDEAFLTFSVTPTAAIVVDGATKADGVPVPNSCLKGTPIQVKLPLPDGFSPKEIMHISGDGSRERFLLNGTGAAKAFTIETGEDGHRTALLSITKFSDFRLNATETKAAVVNGVSYGTLQEAIDAAPAGGTVTLKADCDEAVTVSGKSLTIDFGGHTFDKNKVALGDRCSMKETAGGLAITYTPSTGSSSSSTSGSSGPTNYLITVDKAAGGTVSASAKRASKGSNVTLTVTADSGYVLDELTVTGKNGATLKLTEKNGRYTFTMPASAVTVQASFVPVEAPQNEGLPFTDITADDWFYDAAEYVYGHNLMSGTTDTTFAPGSATTRGMIVTILYRLEGSPQAGGESGAFPDTPVGQYYTDAAAWAAANGIVTGYDNGSFGPNDPITREQLAAILYRYAAHKGYDTAKRADLTGFADMDQISGYALEPLAWANAEGLVNGTGDTTMSPGGQATRAQVAVILMRFCENIAD